MKNIILFGVLVVILATFVHCGEEDDRNLWADDEDLDEDDRALSEDFSDLDDEDLRSASFANELTASLRQADCKRVVVNKKQPCTKCNADGTCSNGGTCCTKVKITLKKKPKGKTCNQSNKNCSKYKPSFLRLFNILFPTTKTPNKNANKKCQCAKTKRCCTTGSGARPTSATTATTAGGTDTTGTAASGASTDTTGTGASGGSTDTTGTAASGASTDTTGTAASGASTDTTGTAASGASTDTTGTAASGASTATTASGGSTDTTTGSGGSTDTTASAASTDSTTTATTSATTSV